MAARFLGAVRLASWVVLGWGAVLSAQEGGVRIAPRDLLNIQTWNEPNYSCKCQVGQDGNIDFPFLGQLQVAGLTTRDVQESLKKALAAKYLVNPQVIVELEQSSSKHFSILGEVRVPGSYPFAGDITIYDALAKAGSTTDAAGDVAILRRGTSGASGGATDNPGQSSDTLIQLHELLSGGSLKTNITLRDGDILLVPKAEPIYVSGEVKAAGQYPPGRNMTVFQAVTLAGGLSPRGKWTGIEIQRKVEGKKDQKFTVKDPKVEIVKPGDTIIVHARIM